MAFHRTVNDCARNIADSGSHEAPVTANIAAAGQRVLEETRILFGAAPPGLTPGGVH